MDRDPHSSNDGEKPRYPALSLLQRAAILSVAVAQFLVGHGRVWAKPFDWDRSIVWSYATIAVLVMAVLAFHRRLTALGWFLHTAELVGIKFALTAAFLITFLIAARPTPSRPTIPAVGSAPTRIITKAKPPPTVLSPATLGQIDGMVLDERERPVERALVFVADGLSDFSAQSPRQPLLLRNDGLRFSPALAAIQIGQPLQLQSTNHQLHTVQMKKKNGNWVLNVPVLGSGELRTLDFDEPKGLVSIRCTVHQAQEGQAYLAILNHPFFVFTEAQGAFALRDVPARRLTLSAFHPKRGEASTLVQLSPRQTEKVRLVLHRR